MATLTEAKQARIAVRLQCSKYSWYSSSGIDADSDGGYCVVIAVKRLDDNVRQSIPEHHHGVKVKLELEEN